MPKTVWGRNETIIWPRYMPIYTYAAAFGVAFLTFIAVCIRIHLATPLERYCLPAYERSSAFGTVFKTHKNSYRLLFVGGSGSPTKVMRASFSRSLLSNASSQTLVSCASSMMISGTVLHILRHRANETASDELPYVGVAAWTTNSSTQSTLLASIRRAVSGP
jgi:hypothetical protein